MVWTQNEHLRLARAWQESLKAKNGDGKAGKKTNTVTGLNKAIYERFEALSGDSSSRSIYMVVARKELLQHSYDFIRGFRNDNAGMEWFALATKKQRALMKTAGGERVVPLDEHVFSALDKFLGTTPDEIEAETESSEATETDGDSSEGDKYQKVFSQRMKPARKKMSTSRSPVKGITNPPEKAVKSALEEDTGELREERAEAKRRRVKSPREDVGVKEIMEQQSVGLVGFLEKRAEERAREQERNRQEREADQKFWAEETAKDRALLRELFTHD
ncbi:unnamed protein product [Phytophthora fragariaefolia]|uniref:Unnamed protein product n=1 Tax=Phytophthora fragariaefolia TaxID=1490495 RepID=A0A9W6Y0F1_9STRA|nr:unnamed protein product [Phytophthora fragariaefolia]